MVRRTGLLVVAAVLLAGVADAQYVRPARMDETGWEALGAPSGCASGYVPYFDASLKLVCAPTVYAPTTDTTTVGTLVARNVTVTALPAAGAVTVTPTLSQVGGITVVAGSLLADGDALSVGDGVGVVPIEFDASPGDGTTGGAVAIVFDGTETATQIRDAVKAILDGAGRDWTTSAQAAAGIGLVRATPGATGGAITETVTNAGFLVTDWTNPTAATTYTYSLQACAAGGTCTEAGAASTTALGVATLSALNYNALGWSAVTGAASYKVRRDVGGATQGVIWSGTGLAVNDTGLAGDGTAKPIAPTTGTVQAANYKTDANGNVAAGWDVLRANTTGSYAAAVGHSALRSNTTGSYGTAIGYTALRSNTNGSYGTAAGAFALFANTNGSYGTAIGSYSLYYNTTGGNGTAVGSYSLYANTTSSNGTAVGHSALRSNTTGGNGTAIGYESGYNTGAAASIANAATTSANVTFLGYRAGLGSSTQRSNSTAIGANAYVDADNRVVLGDGSVVDVWAGSTGQARLVGTGLRLNTGTRPTCDATTRGLIWYVAGGAGVADTCEVCVKSALDAYAWVSLF